MATWHEELGVGPGAAWYEVLGVRHAANWEEIEAARKELTLKYHPDRCKLACATEIMQAVNDAYETAKTEAKGAYNAYKEAKRTKSNRSRKKGRKKGRRKRTPAPLQGTNIRRNATIKWAEAQVGLTRSLRVDGRSIRVPIPAGTPDGEKITVSGAGNPGQHGGSNGDLIVTVKVKPAPQVQHQPIKGADIQKSVTVKWAEAQIGLTRTVSVDGRSIRVPVPAGTPDGEKITVSGAGNPGQHGGANGDLIVTVNVQPAPVEWYKVLGVRPGAAWHEILGVSPTASWQEIQTAWRNLQRQYHPDRCQLPCATEIMQAVNDAYQRAQEANPNRSRKKGRKKGGRKSTPAPRKGSNIRRKATIKWTEAQVGLTKTVSVDGRSVPVPIPAGTVDGETIPITGAGNPGQHGGANGDLIVTFRVKKPAPIKGANIYRSITIEWAEAQDGLTRSLRVDGRSVSVKILAGTPDGKTIPITGEGEPGQHGGANGDLIVTVRVKKPAPIKGANIYRSITIEWAEAQDGLTRSLRVDGRSVSVKILAGTPDGKTIPITGEGEPGQHGGANGDLIVTVRVKKPAPIKGADIHETVNITLEEAYFGLRRAIWLQGRNIADRIPRGADTGMRVPIAGAGKPGQHGGKPGNLIVTVRVEEHAQFKRTGDNLEVDVPVDWRSAFVGAEVDVPTITGAKKLLVPPGSQTGTQLSIAGAGMPSQKRLGDFGDLIVRLTVTAPPPRDGADVHETITISLQEAFTGSHAQNRRGRGGDSSRHSRRRYAAPAWRGRAGRIWRQKWRFVCHRSC